MLFGSTFRKGGKGVKKVEQIYLLEKGKPKKTCYLAPPLEKVEKVRKIC
jgi:hypothetical protein